MSERKIQRYVVLIRQTLDNTGVFNATIYVPFVPDEVKVKQTGLFVTGALAGVFSINCDSLASQSGSSFGIIGDPYVSFSGITYPLGRSVNGSHTFQILTVAGVPATTLAPGQLFIHLEFRRWV